MLLHEVFLDLLGFLLVFVHLLVPVIVELCDFLDMGHFDLFLLFLMFLKHLFAFRLIDLLSHFGQFFLCQVSLNVLAGFLALLLMRVQDLPK